MTFLPVVISSGVLILFFADRRLKAAAQPLRLRLAEKGEDFLNRPDLPETVRRHVKFLLDHAFGMRLSLLMALFMIPAIAVLFVANQRVLLRSVEKMKLLSPADRATFFEICRLHDRITLTNHYFLLPIIELEMVLFMPLAIVLRGIIRGNVPETGGRESVISYIEDKRIHGLRLKHSHAAASTR
jgi:hypothetical protein